MKTISLWKSVLAVSALFLGLFVVIFLQRGGISGSDVIISIEGPDTFKAQEAVEFTIKLKNQSNAKLEDVVVFITAPDFIQFEDFDGAELRINIGTLSSREEEERTVVLFGKDTEREGALKARTVYSPKNLQGVFESTTEKAISVSSLPLTVIFNIPQKVVDGQRLQGAFHFVADSKMEKLPLFARMTLPEGFVIEDSEPIPFEDTTWKFDEVEVGESYQVEFEGVLRGNEGDTKIFELSFGDKDEDGIFLPQYITSKSASISSSPLSFSQKVNGAESFIASPGDRLNFSIEYANKSGVDIEDIAITARFNGDIFDMATIEEGLGYFNKNTRTLVWDKNFLQKLAKLKKGDSGEIQFSISLKDSIAPKNFKDKNIAGMVVSIIESANIPLALKGLSLRSERKTDIKMRTAPDLFAKAYYYEGPFSNSGPIPPRVGEETTYTILWQITNTLNNMKGVKIAAPLPQNVVFKRRIYPDRDTVTYDSSTHSVSWDVGELSAGVGSIFPVETVAFQVSVTPTDAMRGKTFELVEQSKISGTDSFTQEFLEDFASPLNSSLPDDTGIKEGEGVVR